MATMNIFESGHDDRVTVIDHNFYGNRILTGSFDHKLKVFELRENNETEIVDSWTAHDGHIMDVSSKYSFRESVLMAILRLSGFTRRLAAS